MAKWVSRFVTVLCAIAFATALIFFPQKGHESLIRQFGAAAAVDVAIPLVCPCGYRMDLPKQPCVIVCPKCQHAYPVDGPTTMSNYQYPAYEAWRDAETLESSLFCW